MPLVGKTTAISDLVMFENELKKCIQQGNDGLYISTTQRYIDVNSDQLSQAVELL